MTESPPEGRRSGFHRYARGLLLLIAALGIGVGTLRVFDTDFAANRHGAVNTLHREISGPDEFSNFLLGLRSYQYRARKAGSSSIREHYFDTPDWALAKHGLTLRLVEPSDFTDANRYELRLEGLPVPTVEIIDEIPFSHGRSLLEGTSDFSTLDFGALMLEAFGARLSAILDDLDRRPGELGSRGAGDLSIDHFEIRDKGHTWFELDYRAWRFSAIPGEDQIYRMYSISLKPTGDSTDEEFAARSEQMRQVLPTFFNFRSESEPRITRAIRVLDLHSPRS